MFSACYCGEPDCKESHLKWKQTCKCGTQDCEEKHRCLNVLRNMMEITPNFKFHNEKNTIESYKNLINNHSWYNPHRYKLKITSNDLFDDENSCIEMKVPSFSNSTEDSIIIKLRSDKVFGKIIHKKVWWYSKIDLDEKKITKECKTNKIPSGTNSKTQIIQVFCFKKVDEVTLEKMFLLPLLVMYYRTCNCNPQTSALSQFETKWFKSENYLDYRPSNLASSHALCEK